MALDPLKFDLVALAHPRVLVVMVSASGLVTHKVIEVEERLRQRDRDHMAKVEDLQGAK